MIAEAASKATDDNERAHVAFARKNIQARVLSFVSVPSLLWSRGGFLLGAELRHAAYTGGDTLRMIG
jgi:hypothetical protein